MVDVNGTDIDFDAMSDEQLREFIEKLRAENATKKPRAKKASGEVAEPKKRKEYIKVEL